jgi:hypothetical protein
LVLARVDNSKNEIMGQYVEDYPTLFLYKGGDKTNPIKFVGNNTEEGVTQFLKNNLGKRWVEPEAVEIKTDL